MARRELSPAQLSLLRAVTGAVDALPGDRPLRLGLSGGPDSLALAAGLAHLLRNPRTGGLVDVEAVVVDHGLQPGSHETARQAARQAAGLGLPARVVQVAVDPEGRGLEAAARQARLDALAEGAGAVLLGHTLDDQAETVLLGLGRGSGATSLQGMAPFSSWHGVPLVRPLLGLRRAEVHRACADWGLSAWQDPMNSDGRFRRVRVRHDLLPLMEEVLGGGVVEALGRTAAMAREDAELLDQLATAVPATRGDGLDVTVLAGQPAALRSRIVRRWLVGLGVPQPGHQHVHRVLALVDDWHGQRGVDLPGGWRVVRRDGTLHAVTPVAAADG